MYVGPDSFIEKARKYGHKRWYRQELVERVSPHPLNTMIVEEEVREYIPSTVDVGDVLALVNGNTLGNSRAYEFLKTAAEKSKYRENIYRWIWGLKQSTEEEIRSYTV